MNFDFGQHWDTRIVPLLSTRDIRSSITKTMKHYLKYEHPGRLYDKKHAPAWHISEDDAYQKAYAAYETKITADLRAAGQFNKKFEQLATPERYNAYIKQKVKPYMEHFERTNIAAYQCKSAWVYWNTNVGIDLAYLVEPNEGWQVIGTPWYATIVNKDRTRVFDLLAYNEQDETKGGAVALREATCTDPHPTGYPQYAKDQVKRIPKKWRTI